MLLRHLPSWTPATPTSILATRPPTILGMPVGPNHNVNDHDSGSGYPSVALPFNWTFAQSIPHITAGVTVCFTGTSVYSPPPRGRLNQSRGNLKWRIGQVNLNVYLCKESNFLLWRNRVLCPWQAPTRSCALRQI